MADDPNRNPAASTMEDDPSNKCPLLEKVPMELLTNILCLLPDKKSLLSTIQTCRALHEAYDMNKSTVATAILFSPMHESVYQELVVSQHLRQQQWHSCQGGMRAIDKAFSMPRFFTPNQLSIERIKLMFTFHENVEWFATRITTKLKNNHPVLKDRPAFKLCASVLNRVRRSLYRLDTYIRIAEKMIRFHLAEDGGVNRRCTPAEKQEAHWCHCFAEIEEHRIKKTFFAQFSSAEIEQMFCILGLLVTEIAPDFNRFIEYDIEMGFYCPNYISNTRMGMPLICQGLGFLRAFICARTYSRQYEVMRAMHPRDWSHTNSTRAHYPRQDDKLTSDLHNARLTAEQWRGQPVPPWIYRTPFYDDGDFGPDLAWRKFGLISGLFDDEQFMTLDMARPWGYVFWDLEMLEAAELVKIDNEGNDTLEVHRHNPIYAEWFPFLGWNNLMAAERMMLACNVKSSLRDWGRIGWFDFDRFPPRDMMMRLISMGPINPNHIEPALDMLGLSAYSHWYDQTHPYDIFEGRDEQDQDED
ncbi:hypothetical protein ACHAPT_003932 [Fusarium lateritium]